MKFFLIFSLVFIIVSCSPKSELHEEMLKELDKYQNFKLTVYDSEWLKAIHEASKDKPDDTCYCPCSCNDFYNGKYQRRNE